MGRLLIRVYRQGTEGYEVRIRYGIDITFKNKVIDKQWKEFFKLLRDVDIPSNEAPQLYDRFYNVILKFYAEQSKEISNFYQEYGAYTKEARKAQKTVVKLADKYKKKRSKTLKKIS